MQHHERQRDRRRRRRPRGSRRPTGWPQPVCWPRIVPNARPPDRQHDHQRAEPVEVAAWRSRRATPARSGSWPRTRSAGSGTLIKKAAPRDVSTSTPPTNGPRIVVAADAPAQMPNARPCSSPSKLAVMMASDPGTSSAPAAPCRTRKTISNSMVGDRPHSSEVTPNADQADGEHPPAAVVVVHRAGEDQQRAEGDEVAVRDVGLGLERAEEGAMQVLADPRQRDVHDRRVEEDDARAQDDGHHRPSLLCGRHRRGHAVTSVRPTARATAAR